MTPKALLLTAVAASLATVTTSTLIIHSRYQAALRHEIEDRKRQLRTQAETLLTEHETRRRKIETIRIQLKTVEAALAAAMREAESSRCYTIHARVDAAIALKQVTCYQQFLQHAECSAARERERSRNARLGARGGAGLAAATGASTLLLATAGALIASESAGGSCPLPGCQISSMALRDEVLRERGIDQLPRCRAAQ